MQSMQIGEGKSNLRRFWRENKVLLIILAVVLILRLFVLFTEGNRMFLGTDDDNYRESAEILLNKGVLTYAGWPEPTVFIMPGYPIILAAIFAAVGSTNWFAARLFQVLVSLATLWFSVKIAERLGGRWTGIIAGILLAIYPPNLTAPCFLMTETIFTFFLIFSLWCFLKAEETDETKWFVITGIMLGLATYFRPTIALQTVIFGFYLLIRGWPFKKAFFKMLLTGIIMVLCLTPWIIRNYIIYKEFIPLTVSGGNPFLRGTYIHEKITEKFPWIKGPRILSDKAQMEYGKKRLLNGFRNDFWGYLRWYTIDKFKDFWNGPYYYKQLTYLPAKWVNTLHSLLMDIGVLGIIVGIWRRKPLVWLLLLTSAYFTVLHMAYLTGPRYSYPLVQLIIIIASYFIVTAVKTLKNIKIIH